MKKIYFKRLLEFIFFFVILVVSVNFLSKLFMPKWITKKDNYERFLIDSFYKEKKNSIDLIFLGNSDSYYGIYPMELWNSYGITSFSYSKPGARVWIDYYNLKNVLKTQKPKYVFYSVDDFFSINQSRNGDIMKSITGMKESINKLNAIADSNVQKNKSTKLSYIFPIIRFHSRYNELNSDDFKYVFKKAYMPTKGTVISDDIEPFRFKKDYMNKKRSVEVLEDRNKEYIEKIIKLCEKNNIKLVFYELPSADSWGYIRHNVVQKFADENNIPFVDLNMNMDRVRINWNTDSRDGGDHLNVLGALKATKYMGEWINNNCDLENHKGEEKYNSWNNEYQEFIKLKDKALNEVREKGNKRH